MNMSGKLICCGCFILGFTLGINCFRNSTGCYGTEQSLLKMDCPSMSRIAVPNLFFVAKLSNQTDCKPPITNDTSVYCCEHEANDCEIAVFNTTNDEYNYIPMLEACTGQRTCNERVQWIRSHDHCNSSLYFEYTAYLRAFYICVQESSILKNNSNSQLKGEGVYIQSTAYPNVTERLETWQCSIETICSGSIVITAIDVYLTCVGGTIDCTNNNNYEFKKIHQSDSNFMSLKINVTEGKKFWIKLSASDSVSSIDVRCGVARLPTALESCSSSTESVSTSQMESTTFSYSTLSQNTPTTATPDLADTTETNDQISTTTGIVDPEDTTNTNDRFPATQANTRAATLGIGGIVGIVIGVLVAVVFIGYIIYKQIVRKTKEFSVEIIEFNLQNKVGSS